MSEVKAYFPSIQSLKWSPALTMGHHLALGGGNGTHSFYIITMTMEEHKEERIAWCLFIKSLYKLFSFVP
jgi:hypothetical protein